MSIQPFTIRVRLDDGRTGCYPVKPRAGELVVAAVRRAVRAASHDPRADLRPRTDSPILSEIWRCAYRLSFTHAARGAQHGDVDVPAFFCPAWL